MFYLFSCIFCSSVLYIIFKSFEKYRVDLIQAIVVNYLIAGSLGFILAAFYGNDISLTGIVKADWSQFTLLIGLMFISIFNLMGISSQKVGVSTTSVANKMSVVLPVIFGFVFLKEIVTGLKVTGILLAVLALVLTTFKSEKQEIKSLIIFPIIIFFASGVLDIISGYCSKKYMNESNTAVFTACLFSVAALIGLIYLIVLLIQKKQKLKGRNILAGVVLGIPNFGSILFSFEGIKATHWDVSVFFPVLNMGVVVMATILGWIVYREKLSLVNIAGIVIAVLAIYLISF